MVPTVNTPFAVRVIAPPKASLAELSPSLVSCPVVIAPLVVEMVIAPPCLYTVEEPTEISPPVEISFPDEEKLLTPVARKLPPCVVIVSFTKTATSLEPTSTKPPCVLIPLISPSWPLTVKADPLR